MIKRALFSTTAIAVGLFAAGAAEAADVMPVMQPVVVAPVAPVVVPGPVYAITMDAEASTSINGGVDLTNVTALDVRLASGWGFKLALETGLDFDPVDPVGGSVGILARVYRAIGSNATVGVFVDNTFYWEFGAPGVGRLLAAGIDADYETDTAEVDFVAAALFAGGTYLGFEALLATKFDVGEHIRIETNGFVVAPASSSLVAIGTVKLGYQMGPVTPYILAGVGFTPTVTGGIAIGADLEHAFGPLTLTAGVQLGFTSGLSALLTGGFEYALGGEDGPLTLRGEVEYDLPGGYWSASVGIGLKFGPGRVSGADFAGFAL